MLGDNIKKPELEEADENDPKKGKGGYSFPWSALLIFGILAIFISICIIFICVFGGPIVE